VRIIKNNRIIPLAALAIAIFMALPRLIIVAYFKANPTSRMVDITWGDLIVKFIYSFLIAWGFLWLNVRVAESHEKSKFLHGATFSHRLLWNIIILIFVKTLFHFIKIPDKNEVTDGKGLVFLFNISLILEVVICFLLGELYRLFKSNQYERLNNERLLKANAQATLDVLKNQVNPHFLFNSLNTINAMIDSDVDAAKRFVTNMAQVYRHILNSSGKHLITLNEELEFTTAYINMLLERHNNSLFIELSIPPEYRSFLIPPVSLQVLIENTIKHNVVSLAHPLTVTIREKDGYLVVSNKLNERKQKTSSTGTGLSNLDQRYQHISGKGIEIIKNEDLFSVSLPLLKMSQGNYVLALVE